MFKFLFTLIEGLLRNDADAEEPAEKVDGEFLNYVTGETEDMPAADGVYDIDFVDDEWISDIRT